MRTARGLLAALLHAWPQKLGALALATLIWLFVNINDTSTTQRSLFVPITIEGLSASSVATGLPEFVEVTVAGPSGQIDRLRPENFEAILDLGNESGSFEVPIEVLSPRGVDLLRVSPSDVIGSLEAVTGKEVPASPVLIGQAPPNSRLTTRVEPEVVAVRARASTLAQVTRVLVPVAAASGTSRVTPYAVDSQGRPVAGVTVEPSALEVEVTEQQVLVRRQVPVDLETPSLAGYTVTARLEQEQVELIGPPATVVGLDGVSGSVSLPTGEPEAGGYTLPVTLDLPEGIFQAGTVSATVRLSRPPIEP